MTSPSPAVAAFGAEVTSPGRRITPDLGAALPAKTARFEELAEGGVASGMSNEDLTRHIRAVEEWMKVASSAIEDHANRMDKCLEWSLKVARDPQHEIQELTDRMDDLSTSARAAVDDQIEQWKIQIIQERGEREAMVMELAEATHRDSQMMFEDLTDKQQEQQSLLEERIAGHAGQIEAVLEEIEGREADTLRAFQASVRELEKELRSLAKHSVEEARKSSESQLRTLAEELGVQLSKTALAQPDFAAFANGVEHRMLSVALSPSRSAAPLSDPSGSYCVPAPELTTGKVLGSTVAMGSASLRVLSPCAQMSFPQRATVPVRKAPRSPERSVIAAPRSPERSRLPPPSQVLPRSPERSTLPVQWTPRTPGQAASASYPVGVMAVNSPTTIVRSTTPIGPFTPALANRAQQVMEVNRSYGA